jgi:hypothetical protein
MKLRFSNTLLAVSALVLSVFWGTGMTAFGQGRGHGGDRGGPPQMQPVNGNRGGVGRPQVFSPPQRQQPPQRINPVQAQRPMPQRQIQMPQQNRGWQQRAERPMPQHQIQVPQQNREWQQRAERPMPQHQIQMPQQNRGWQQRVERPMPQHQIQMPQQNRGWQQRPDRSARIDQQRQNSRPDLRAGAQLGRPDFGSQRGNGQWQQGPHDDRSGNRNTLGGWRQNGRSEDPWSNLGRVPPGLIRSQEVHQRNAERHALPADQRSWGGSFGNENWYGSRYGDNNFGRRDRWDDRRRDYWRENSIRNAIVNVIYGNAGGYYDYYPQNYAYYYGTPYNPIYYTESYYSYPRYLNYSSYYGYPLFFTDYYSSAYSNYYDPYAGYYDPYASYYDRYGNYYDAYNAGYYDPYGGYQSFSYDYQPFSYYSQAGYYDSFNDYPYDSDDYCSLSSNTYYYGSLPATYSQLLASGYDEGYSDGLYARYNNYGDRYYYDPYVYEDTGYDPYSYSLGENRRCLSEGYKLGYKDALYGRNQYNPLYNGNVSLVSLLVGSALQTVYFSG